MASSLWLLGVCFLREAPQRAIGSDRRAGKWGLVLGKEGHETPKVGVVLDVTPGVVGLGQRLDVGFKVTEEDIDPKSGGAAIVERASIADTSFTRDASTRLHVETRPDGSRILLLVTPTLIDATGRPVRTAE